MHLNFDLKIVQTSINHVWSFGLDEVETWFGGISVSIYLYAV